MNHSDYNGLATYVAMCDGLYKTRDKSTGIEVFYCCTRALRIKTTADVAKRAAAKAAAKATGATSSGDI